MTGNHQQQRVLITGGAGFIGSHLADELLAAGHTVRVLDSLTPQVHGEERSRAWRPEHLDPNVELQVGDVRDADALRTALADIDVVFHLAAEVGVGQSMYQIADYTSSNALGTATLLEAISAKPIKRLIVASSMSIYGEGLYQTEDGRLIAGAERPREQLARGQWETLGPEGRPLTPVPTPESKTPALASVYALNKFDQEQMCLIVGKAYSIPTVALRLFNVYGTRQALSNPYTGVLAIFLSRLMNGNAPLIYEDGLQKRDFVSVRDVARAFHLAMKAPAERIAGQVFNIGSGRSCSIVEVAERIADVLGQSQMKPTITGTYRVGDIRHCFASIARAGEALGYKPQVGFEDGLRELARWIASQPPESATDRVDEVNQELVARGLTV